MTLCSDNVRSRFAQRQTWVQPSHTVSHPPESSRRHDFVVVMATTAHNYLTKLPWDEVQEMKVGFSLSLSLFPYVSCVIMCKTLSSVGGPRQTTSALCKPRRHSCALEVTISLRRRCEAHFSHPLSAGASSTGCNGCNSVMSQILILPFMNREEFCLSFTMNVLNYPPFLWGEK